MAGAKGRSGGARANSGGARENSGGVRPGAGRKPKEPMLIDLALQYEDPMKFLRAVMNDAATDVKIRVDAAKAQLAYTHAKIGEVGKKDQKQDAAKQAAVGKFAAAAPPKLVAAGGKKL